MDIKNLVGFTLDLALPVGFIAFGVGIIGHVGLLISFGFLALLLGAGVQICRALK